MHLGWRRIALIAAVLTAATGSLTVRPNGAPPAEAAPRQLPPVRADYNGNGRSDLAVGAPTGPTYGPGAVFTRDFRSGVRGQHQIVATGERPDGGNLGEMIASCDLNADRYADLVASTWFVNPFDGPITYGVQVFLGSSSGLQPGARLAHRTTGTPPPVWALACGDVNGDGYDEVAVGDPNLRLRNQPTAGGVRMYPGTANGPTTAGWFTLTQEFPGLPGLSEREDFFGASLAFGDLDGDRYDELVVGAPGERPAKAPTYEDHGAVAVVYGSKSGLSTKRSRYLLSDQLRIRGQFGWAVATGEVTGDGRDDLVVGAPTYIKAGNGVGAAILLKGRRDALRIDQIITQSDKGVAGASSPTNGFGYRISLGDITGDRRADVVVAAPGQTVSGQENAGSITVLAGGSAGFVRTSAQYITRATAGIVGTPRTMDHWPWSLTVVDTSGDGRSEVYAGMSTDREKVVYQLPGSARGVVPSRAVMLTQRDLQPRSNRALTFGRSLG